MREKFMLGPRISGSDVYARGAGREAQSPSVTTDSPASTALVHHQPPAERAAHRDRPQIDVSFAFTDIDELSLRPRLHGFRGAGRRALNRIERQDHR